jgi:hypothetical protein
VKLSLPKFQLALVLVLAAVSAGVVALTYWARTPSFYFEVSMRSSTGGIAQTFYDVGRGISESDSVRLYLHHAKSTAVYRFPLPEAEYRTIRFDPLNHGNANLVIKYARIVDMFGHTLRRFSLGELTVANGISASEIKEGKMSLTLGPKDNDSILIINPGTPLTLHIAPSARLAFAVRVFLLCFLSLVAAGLLWLILSKQLWSGRMQQRWSRFAAWIQLHPGRALLLVAVISAVLNCYPVVFFGRSFVSPSVAMLYGRPPSLPGIHDLVLENTKGSDIGAMFWQNLPYSFLQSRALMRYHELPLWNRYNSSGTPHLGQGLTMFGDPLHLLVVAAGGASWAWDLKFVLAKTFFCWGIGLAVLFASKHLPTSLLFCFSAAFIGFFSYRFNHPAYFSLCYAPWLLACWLGLTRATTSRVAAGWAFGLVLASLAELNSGTVKEAYMLLLSLHLTGFLIFLLSNETEHVRKFLHVICAGVVFILIAAPAWLTFLDTLRSSFSGYRHAPAFQIQPGLAIGLWDEIFYRRINSGGGVFNPSANFLVLLGCLLSLAHFKTLLRDRIFVMIGLGALSSFALVFGVIPRAIIYKIPVLSDVMHIDNTFSCVLIVQLFVLAGFGVRQLWATIDSETRRFEMVIVVLGMALVFGLYLGLTQAHQRALDTFEPLEQAGLHNTFYDIYITSIILSVLALPPLVRTISRHTAVASWLSVPIIACFLALHWRMGMHLNTNIAEIDDCVMNPQVRVDFGAHSPTIDFLKSQTGTFRSVGFGSTFFSGYNDMPGLESIYGADPLVDPQYRELLLSAGMAADWGWRWRVDKTNFESMRPLYNLLNVRYFLDGVQKPKVSAPSFDALPPLDLQVYENRAAWPRAFFVDAAVTYRSVDEFLGIVRQSPDLPMAAVLETDATAISETRPFAAPTGTNPEVVAGRDFRLTNNTTSFVIDVPRPGLVVLTETYSGDFAGTMNGRPTKYFRVNHAFRGIRIPSAGTYAISFSYWPKHFTAALIMFGSGLIVLTLWLGGTFFRRRERTAAIAQTR